MFPCRTVIPADTEFMAAAYEIQNVQNRIYMHSSAHAGKGGMNFSFYYQTAHLDPFYIEQFEE